MIQACIFNLIGQAEASSYENKRKWRFDTKTSMKSETDITDRFWHHDISWSWTWSCQVPSPPITIQIWWHFWCHTMMSRVTFMNHLTRLMTPNEKNDFFPPMSLMMSIDGFYWCQLKLKLSTTITGDVLMSLMSMNDVRKWWHLENDEVIDGSHGLMSIDGTFWCHLMAMTGISWSWSCLTDDTVVMGWMMSPYPSQNQIFIWDFFPLSSVYPV